ncbi:MAG: multicopper oxidase domain-containing protein [Acidobacteria bacterium]|nr:multicopper oxidase domain-containing protein [Acidobacteriota bacterium]
MDDRFWYKIGQAALLFAVIAMLAASLVVQNGSISSADVREILAEEGVAGSDVRQGWPVDQSIRPDLTPISELKVALDSEQHVSYAPDVPAPITRSDQRIYDVHIESIEGVCPLDPANNITTEMWGFRIAGDDEVTCGSPGPVLRGRVGDVVNITLTNLAENTRPHNIDFHAVTGQGGGAAGLTVNPGETATIQIRLLYPGAFMYHCAFGDVPSHIAHGMYGMFIVDPENPLPEVDNEWAIVQSEWYVGEADAQGVAPYDRDAVFNEEPRIITFNGRTDSLVGANTLRMNVGERARIYFVNEGLNLDSNFHPIGSQWDLVYPEAATHSANNVIRGSQTTLVPAGGATVVEIDALVPSTIILVDHALARTFYKGAIGTIEITGDATPELFGVLQPDAETTNDDSDSADDANPAGTEVAILEGAFDPNNADNAYNPLHVTVKVGTTIRWTNDDAIPHTVTSGTSDGSTGSSDGRFDSGFLNLGDTFSHTFTDVGEFSYFCLPHPWMIGTVTVTE